MSWRWRERARARRSIATVVCGVLVAAGCGTRLSREQIVADSGARVVLSNGQTVDGVAGGVDGDEVTAPGVGSPTGTVVGEPAAGSTGGSTGGDGGGPATGATPAAGGGATRSGSASTGGAAADREPIVVGLVGYFSGIGGPVHIPKRDAWLVWAKAVNARGGIAGHPVEVLVGDDGGNDSRALSIARDFVENKGAIALTTTGTTQEGVVTYATSKSIPVIGVAGGPSDQARKSPMMFQTSPGGIDATWGIVAAARSAGAKRIAVIYCAESAECQTNSQHIAAEAKAQGLEVVAQMRASVTQPDFTAECLSARNSDAQLVLPITDNNAPIRIAQSCARQNYRPIFELLSAADSQAAIPELAGAISAQGPFPWFLRSGAPGIDEYVRAFERFAPNRLADGTTDQASAWVAAKVLEKAAAKVSDEPTSRDLLEGLWAMNGETLDGLMPGGLARRYVRGQPTPPSYCTRTAKIQDREWVAPQGLTPLCK